MYIVWGCAEISPATFLATTSIEWTNLHISRFRFRYCFVILIPGSYLLCKAFVYFGQSFAENSYVILNLWFFFFLVEYLFLEFVSFCAKVLYAYPKTKQWKMKKLHTLTELINNMADETTDGIIVMFPHSYSEEFLTSQYSHFTSSLLYVCKAAPCCDIAAKMKL